MIRTKCLCGAKLKVQTEHAGKKVKCPKCQQMVNVPSADTSNQTDMSDILPKAPPWETWLDQCQENYGEPPRLFSGQEIQDYLLFPPEGCLGFINYLDAWSVSMMRGPLLTFFENGIVVWANLLQANTLIFEPGKCDEFAAIVFSLDRSGAATPALLEDVAAKLVSTRGTQPSNTELRVIANYLTGQRSIACGMPVPKSVENIPCIVSTTILLRKHLPGGILSKSLFPIVVSLEPPHRAMVLPARFWPERMLDWWSTAD